MAHSGTRIYMSNVPADPDSRILTQPLPLSLFEGGTGNVPRGFIWDGATIPTVFSPFRIVFPRHRHPIATCRHDYRCITAKSYKERRWADKEFEKDVGTTSLWLTKKLGYFGVSTRAFWTWKIKPTLRKIL